MIIPLDELEPCITSHSDYQHLRVCSYKTDDNDETLRVNEITRFGNPHDYINLQYKVTYEVFAGWRSEEGLENTFTLPANCKSVECHIEPYVEDGKCVWAYVYNFDEIEDAYAYAITQKWSEEL